MKVFANGAAAASAALLFSIAAPADAWVPHTASIAAVKASVPPQRSADVRGPEWKTATAFDQFYDFTNHRPAGLATSAYLLYDDTNLYLSVHCEQHGVPIVAAQRVDHAGVSTDDHISLNLETSGSGGRVYQFRANPKGIHDEYSSENSRFAPEWQSLAKIDADGNYDLLFIVPLSVLRAQSAATQTWQINVVRFVAHENDEYTWAYDDTMNSVGSPQYWPRLTSISIPASASRPKPHFDFYGLGNAGSDRGVFQDGVGNFEQTKVRPYGVDATVPLTNTISFVGTLNPDFSNVEADQTTIAPQEFQRQYSEYRPFFAQGANYFSSLPEANINSNDIMFYSPRIGIFDRGLKIEGTQGLSQIGLLNVTGDGFDDNVLGYMWSRSDNSFSYGVNAVNANHDGIRDDTFGYALATTNPHSGLFALARMSHDRGTFVDTPGQGNDFQVAGGLQNAHTTAIFNYRDVGPQYDPIDGYITNNDIRGPQVFYMYGNAGPKGAFIKSYMVSAGADRFLDRSGAVHQADVFSGANITTRNLVSVGYSQTTSELRFYQQPFPVYASGTTGLFNQQSLSLGYRDGTPAPIDLSYSWGPFENNQLQDIFLQQSSISTSQQLGRWGLGVTYAGNVERPRGLSLAPALDTQWLRSLSVSRSFGKNASLAVGLRGVNGTGGYALPGTNLAASFHERFANANELYIVYGTPAAVTTLNRFLVKYIFHTGGGTGT